MGSDQIRILHQRGKSGVIARLLECPGEIGIIDEDPWANQHPGVSKFVFENSVGPFDLYRHQECEKTRLIIMKPYLEEIIIDVAENEGIDPTPYGLELDPRSLHQMNPYKNLTYQRFLDELLASTGLFQNIFSVLKSV
ncbi:MAG: hypothetical protein KAH57_06285 [Thermoplasmata archaeon]|nr:hypothetical protein [Thermoplasmata archaeon]